MADFDWYGTCAAIHATGACEAVLAADSLGNIFSSYPLADDGNYQFWVFTDPYKATVTKEDGTEAEEDVYEAHNLGLLVTGQKEHITPGVGVRINGVKYMWVREMKGETYQAKITDADGSVNSHPVTIESVHLLQKGNKNIMVGVKNGYVFAALADKSNTAMSAPSVIAALAVGFYWACGADQ